MLPHFTPPVQTAAKRLWKLESPYWEENFEVSEAQKPLNPSGPAGPDRVSRSIRQAALILFRSAAEASDRSNYSSNFTEPSFAGMVSGRRMFAGFQGCMFPVISVTYGLRRFG